MIRPMLAFKKTNTTKNQKETVELGSVFAKKLEPGAVVLLSGDLGSGKTAFVKGMAKSLGIVDSITSPTFTIMNAYEIKNKGVLKTVMHADLYRLHHEQELFALGILDYMRDQNTISIIEWPEKIMPFLSGISNKKKYELRFSLGEKNNARIITQE